MGDSLDNNQCHEYFVQTSNPTSIIFIANKNIFLTLTNRNQRALYFLCKQNDVNVFWATVKNMFTKPIIFIGNIIPNKVSDDEYFLSGNVLFKCVVLSRHQDH